MPLFEVSIATGSYRIQARTNTEAISAAIKQAVHESIAQDVHAGILDWVQVAEIGRGTE